ncbi:MAG: hypothetical protein QNJ62_05040 [Methyloceanibacter sp.]|nr:hypothetical protein [Methyloceanibacter sp.]
MKARDILLKEATLALIQACGGLKQAAKHCRPEKSSLANYASQLHPKSFIPADAQADLEEHCGQLLVTFIHAQTGAKPPEPEEPNPHKTVNDLAIQIGAFAREAEIAMEDEQLSVNECDRLLSLLMAFVKLVEKARHDLTNHKVVQLRAREGG